MTLNDAMTVICVISPNGIGQYVRVIEAEAILSEKNLAQRI